MKVPQLRKKSEIKSCHNVTWEDNYSWIHQKDILEVLKDKNKLNPEVKEYLEQENEYADYHLRDTKDLQKKHKYFLKELRPVLANRYFRSYHSSADNKYRVTTDTSLNFTNLINGSLIIPYWKKPKDITIVELKFKNQDDHITNFMTEIKSRYRLSQISKYTYGLQL